MKIRYLPLAALLLAGTGCSFIQSRLPSSVTSKTATAQRMAAQNTPSQKGDDSAASLPVGAGAPAMAPAAKVEVGDKDPVPVKNMAERVYAYEAAIRERGLPRLEPRFTIDFWTHPSETLAASPRYPEFKQRIQAMDVEFAKVLGERATRLVGDAHRAPGASAEEMAFAREVVDLCNKAADMVVRSEEDAAIFKQREQAYVDAVSTLATKAPRALHHVGDANRFGSPVDMVAQLLYCEAALAGVYRQMEDTYVPEPAVVAEYEKGCATQVMELSAEKVGNKWGTWGITSPGYAVKVPCGKLARKSTAPADAIRDLLARGTEGSLMKGDVLVQQGKVDYWNDDETIPPTPHKTITVVRHGKKVPILKNPCGKDGLACEQGGSKTAVELNRTQFYLARADAHRGAKNPRACQHFVKAAEKSSKDFLEAHAFSVKLGTWVKDLRYKTRAGDVLSEAQVLERFRQAQKTAEDRKLGYCTASK